MKEQFTAYLKNVGMSDVLIKRVETIHRFYEICPEELTGIFVSEVIKEDGNREYGSLWFFSKTYVMEAKSFISKDDFDITPLHKRVSYWSIEKQDYDFIKATEKSRMNLRVGFKHPTSGDFRASKENCDFLRDIIQNHIMPNMI